MVEIGAIYVLDICETNARWRDLRSGDSVLKDNEILRFGDSETCSKWRGLHSGDSSTVVEGGSICILK